MVNRYDNTVYLGDQLSVNVVTATNVNTNVFTGSTISTTNLTSSNALIFPDKLNYALFEGSVSVTVGVSDTLIQWTSPSYPRYDAGSFKFKFSTRGIYRIDLWINYDGGASDNYFDIKLKENGGAVSEYVRCYTGPDTKADSNPFYCTFYWLVFNVTDIVGVYGNRGAADVTGVKIKFAHISQIQRFL